MMPRAGALRRVPPCEGVPSISSVGTSTVTQSSDCSITQTEITTSVTLSGSLPTGALVEFREYFGTSATPTYGSWTTLFSSGSSGSRVSPAPDLLATSDNGNASNTYYYNVQFRVIGTDGSTVCDGDGPFPTQWTDTLWDCTA